MPRPVPLRKLPEIRAGAAALMGAPVASPVGSPVAKPVAQPWAVTWYSPYKSVVLRQGSRGTAALVLQRALKLTADGAFGPATRVAVVAFQKQQKITQDGVVGPVAWARLERRDYPLIAYRSVTLKQGSTGAVVKVAQHALRVTADGAFGPKTTAVACNRFTRLVTRVSAMPEEPRLRSTPNRTVFLR